MEELKLIVVLAVVTIGIRLVADTFGSSPTSGTCIEDVTRSGFVVEQCN
jgi:hypothetical protein